MLFAFQNEKRKNCRASDRQAAAPKNATREGQPQQRAREDYRLRTRSLCRKGTLLGSPAGWARPTRPLGGRPERKGGVALLRRILGTGLHTADARDLVKGRCGSANQKELLCRTGFGSPRGRSKHGSAQVLDRRQVHRPRSPPSCARVSVAVGPRCWLRTARPAARALVVPRTL